MADMAETDDNVETPNYAAFTGVLREKEWWLPDRIELSTSPLPNGVLHHVRRAQAGEFGARFLLLPTCAQHICNTAPLTP